MIGVPVKQLHLNWRQKRFWLGGLLLLLVALGVPAVRWLSYERQPLPQALAALESDPTVTVTQTPWLTFTPQDVTVTTGFIFYPGGRISYLGYADLLRTMAEHGYLVVSPRMPLNIAATNPNAANGIIAAHPEIQHWVIGGHSVGGTMAAQYTSRNRADCWAGDLGIVSGGQCRSLRSGYARCPHLWKPGPSGQR